MESLISFIYTLSSSEEPELVRYVGYSCNPQKRLISHLYESKSKKCYRHHWINYELNKGNVILLNIIGCFPESEICDKEKEFIKVFKAVGAKLVNSNNGGKGGLSPSKETREKNRISKIGNKWNIGKKMSDSLKKKLKEINKRKILTKEDRDKMYEAAKKKGFIKNKRKVLKSEFIEIFSDYKKGIKPKVLSIKYNHPIRRIYNILYLDRIYKDLR